MRSPTAAQPDVSILIKAYREEGRVGRAIASALAAQSEIAPLTLEVVVADGLSDDATVDEAIAAAVRHPVRVVQLTREQDRSCGAGWSLAYEWSQGRSWIFLMDADMRLVPGFLARGIRHLQHHPKLAGVAAGVVDVQSRNGVDRIRINNALGTQPGVRPWLEGGGLYRRSAIEGAGGYVADHRLAAFEEADLGLRLRRAGWQLARLDGSSVLHSGHETPTGRLLLQRWHSGRAAAAGLLLRLHGLRLHGGSAVRLLAHPLGLALGWLMTGLVFAQGLASGEWQMAGSWGLVAASAAGIQCWRKRDVRHVLTALADWHLMLAGIVWGLSRHPNPRRARLPSRLLADGAHRLRSAQC